MRSKEECEELRRVALKLENRHNLGVAERKNNVMQTHVLCVLQLSSMSEDFL